MGSLEKQKNKKKNDAPNEERKWSNCSKDTQGYQRTREIFKSFLKIRNTGLIAKEKVVKQVEEKFSKNLKKQKERKKKLLQNKLLRQQ